MGRKIYFLRFIICLLSAIMFVILSYFISKDITSLHNRIAFITSISALAVFASFILLMLYKKNIALIVCKRELKKKHPEIDHQMISLNNFSYIEKPLGMKQNITLNSSKKSAFYETEITTSSDGYVNESLNHYSFDKNDCHLVFISTPYFIGGQILSVDQPRVQKIFRFKNGKTYILSFSQRIKDGI